MSCTFFSVYERKFSEGDFANFKCESCSTVEIVWANYGVHDSRQYPFAISASNKKCIGNDATSVVQNKCNGKITCSFQVQRRDFLESNCEQSMTLLVRYKCRRKIPGTSLSKIITIIHNAAKPTRSRIYIYYWVRWRNYRKLYSYVYLQLYSWPSVIFFQSITVKKYILIRQKFLRILHLK
jgi:hypothetical protein